VKETAKLKEYLYAGDFPVKLQSIHLVMEI
jgi:hypothetical protein